MTTNIYRAAPPEQPLALVRSTPDLLLRCDDLQFVASTGGRVHYYPRASQLRNDHSPETRIISLVLEQWMKDMQEKARN